MSGKSPRERKRLIREMRRRDKPVLRQVSKNTRKLKKQTKNFADKKHGCAVTALAVGTSLVTAVATWKGVT